MADIIEMPKLSDTMTDGRIVKWLKKEGDQIKEGDVIAEIETDKATMDMESFVSGTLLKIVVGDGASAPCKSPVAVVGKPGEKIDESLLKAAPAAEAKKEEPKKEAPAATPAPKAAPATTAPTVSTPTAVSVSGGKVKASPLAKKIAAELNVNLSNLTGSGPGGRIVRADVLNAKQTGGAGSDWGLHPIGPVAKDERIALTGMRRAIATRLTESKQQIPHFYVEMEVDMAPAMVLRTTLNAKLEKLPKPVKLSFNDFVLKACAEAIRKIPSINSSFEGDAVRQFSSVGLAFGVAIPGGLITPVIRDAQNKSLKAISEEAKELAAKAKAGKLKPEEYTTGTFTVSNLGMFGVDRFSAIVNPPQAAILAVGNIVKKPVVDANDNIVVGYRMSITLSADHRVVDGADGALFLKEIKELLESPALLLV